MSLSENVRSLKEKDYTKYLACMFAPKEKREALFALFNFHQEISEIPVEVSEPMVGLIKIQWWRDVIAEIKDGKLPRPHPVLLALVKEHMDFAKLNLVLDSYQKVVEGWTPQSFTELESFIKDTECSIHAYAADLLQVKYDVNLVLAYSYIHFAIKLKRFSKAHTDKLLARAAEILPKSNSALAVITRHYIATKGLEKQRWKLLLKLLYVNSLYG